MACTFQPYPVIDGHAHLSLTSTQSWTGNADEIGAMREALGLSAICVQNIVLWMTRNLPRNPISLLMKLRFPGVVFSFGGIRYPMPSASGKPYDYASQAQRLMGMGFDGIKLFGKPSARREFGQPLDSPVFDEMFSYLEEQDVPVLYHIADPADFWHKERMSPEAIRLGWYCGPDTPPFEQFLEELERMLDKHPRLRVVFPHFLFLADNLPECAGFLSRHPNARIDITPGTELYRQLAKDIEASRAFFGAHQDRIHFGTDNTGTAYGNGGLEEQIDSARRNINSIRTFLEREEGEVFDRNQPCLALSEGVLERIYAGNFRRFVSDSPKAVDAEEALRYTQELIAEAEKAGDSAEAAEILRQTRDRLGKFAR